MRKINLHIDGEGRCYVHHNVDHVPVAVLTTSDNIVTFDDGNHLFSIKDVDHKLYNKYKDNPEVVFIVFDSGNVSIIHSLNDVQITISPVWERESGK